MDPLIQIQNLSVGYDKVPVIENVNIDIEPIMDVSRLRLSPNSFGILNKMHQPRTIEEQKYSAR